MSRSVASLLGALGALGGALSFDAVLHPELGVEGIGTIGQLRQDMLPSAGYDGMMFAGGMRINGSTFWVARICTKGCTQAPYDSKVMLGQVEKRESSEAWSWTQGAEVPVAHSSKGSSTGPEDPRLDAVQGQRFILANVNVEPGDENCPTARKQVFVPIDAKDGSRQCVIQVDEPNMDGCGNQKNWVPLVPRGSSTPFFVYSLVPFQVMSLDRISCKAKAMQSGGVRTPDLSNARSSTRYVHGMDVAEGSIYWSFGHTAPLEYKPILTAVLVTGEGRDAAFELLGTSCGFRIPGLLTQGDLFAYPNSVLGFNATTDLAEVTFHVDDKSNKVVTLRGIGMWLRKAYSVWKKGASFKCVAATRMPELRFLSSSNSTNSTPEPTTESTPKPTLKPTTPEPTTTAESTAVVSISGSALVAVENATEFCADPLTVPAFESTLAEKIKVAASSVEATCGASSSGSSSDSRRLTLRDVAEFTYTIRVSGVDAEEVEGSGETILGVLANITKEDLATSLQQEIVAKGGQEYQLEVQDLVVPTKMTKEKGYSTTSTTSPKMPEDGGGETTDASLRLTVSLVSGLALLLLGFQVEPSRTQ